MEQINKDWVAGLCFLLDKVKTEQGRTQDHVARETGITPQYLSLMKSGTKPGTEPIRRAVARALGTTYNEVLRIGREINKAKGDTSNIAISIDPPCPAWVRELMPRVVRLKAAEQTMLRKQVEATLEMLEEVRGPTRKTKRSGAK